MKAFFTIIALLLSFNIFAQDISGEYEITTSSAGPDWVAKMVSQNDTTAEGFDFANQHFTVFKRGDDKYIVMTSARTGNPYAVKLFHETTKTLGDTKVYSQNPDGTGALYIYRASKKSGLPYLKKLTQKSSS